jgi:3-methylcrotonyl-CoA carboxylase beta subunit
MKRCWLNGQGICLQVEADKRERLGQDWTEEEQAAFKAGISDRYDAEGHPLYSSARLWDDGIIDPADTRRVLGLAVSAAMHGQTAETRYGVFRM